MLNQKNLQLSIRTKLFLLLLVLFLPACVLIIASSLDNRRHEIKAANNDALLLVQEPAPSRSNSPLGQSRCSAPWLNCRLKRLDAEQCSEIFREVQNRHPLYSNVLATTSDGTVFASSVPLSQASTFLIVSTSGKR